MVRTASPPSPLVSTSSNTSTPRSRAESPFSPTEDSLMKLTLKTALLEHNMRENGHAHFEKKRDLIIKTPPPGQKLSLEEPKSAPGHIPPTLFLLNQTIDTGQLCGIFECDILQEGRDIATYANAHFPEIFTDVLHKSEGKIRTAFKETIKRIHNQIAKEQEQAGLCSCVVSYISAQKPWIYTATLGEDEAKIFRRGEEGDLKAIPLSLVRKHEPHLDLPGSAEPQKRRSRTLSYDPESIPKPKISESPLLPGDVILWGNKELWEEGTTERMIKEVFQNPSRNYAQAISDWRGGDHLAVISLQVNP